MTEYADQGLSSARARVLALLREAGRPLGIAEVGERLGVHPNSARFHLDALHDAGLIDSELERRPGPGRPRALYAAHPGEPGSPRRYQLLSEILVGFLEDEVGDAGAAAERAGRAWSRQLAQHPEQAQNPEHAEHPEQAEPEGAGEILDAVVAGLDRVGFASGVVDDEAGLRLEVRRCPFLEVARGHEQVVCSLHLGLMRGLLESLDAPLGVSELEPLVEPDLCLAHLSRV